MNIVSAVVDAVAPADVDTAARRHRTDTARVRAVVAVTLPAVLALLSGKGATVSGAGAIFDAVKGGDGRRGLGPLLGAEETGAIRRAVARFCEVGEGLCGDVLALLGPVALGVLGGEIGRRGLDKRGFGRFLSDQRAPVMEALPAGFAAHVSGSRYFDAFRTGFVSAPMTATDAADPTKLAQAEYARAVRKPTAMRLGIAMVLAMLAMAWLLFAMTAPPSPDTMGRGGG